MSASLEQIIDDVSSNMKKAIAHLEVEISKIRAGKATPQIVDGIYVDYYGNPTPLSQVANVLVADARTLTIQPWEKNMLGPIEKAIINIAIALIALKTTPAAMTNDFDSSDLFANDRGSVVASTVPASS